MNCFPGIRRSFCTHLISPIACLILVLFSKLINAQNISQDLVSLTQQKKVKNQPFFQVKNPDYKLSPFTGMTRQHWKDAALYLLSGAFSYIDKIEDPMQFPKLPGKSYPRTATQVPTEKLEGLCRTLFVAAPLLKENPNLVIGKIKVADYYRYHILKLLDPNSPTYIKPQEKGAGPNQILVEFGALSVSLFCIPEILFDPLTKEQKDVLAATMLSYGDGKTVGSNWKFFNIFVLSFFKSKGYTVNDSLLIEYLDKSLAHYRGSGWYNDAPAYDYYSMWAFQMYGPVWSEFFGKKYYPEYARKFMENFKPLKENYPYLFSRDAKMIMWGRSMSYRMGSIIPLALTGLENDQATNYGWMRRISSGVLLQFLKNPEFMKDNIPTLGFYGAFEPVVQPYSCRGSVFWMGKAFFALMIPPDNKFWTATENDGAWTNELKKGKVFNKFQDSSNILLTDYPDIGASEVRAWCNVKAIGAREPFRASENYNKLSYNSNFPWMADSADGVISMNYIFKNKNKEWEPLRLYTFKKYENGAYYRDAVLETHPEIKLSLTDIPLANGILRVDKISSDTAYETRLGHYALPNRKGTIKQTKKKVKGYDVQIIDNGQYQLAMVSIMGWKTMTVKTPLNVHPETKACAVINVSSSESQLKEPNLIVTLMLWKKSGELWRDDELVPIKEIHYDSKTNRVSIQTLEKTMEISW